MNSNRSMIIAVLIFAMLILTFRTGSHTINGYPSPEQMRALDDAYDNAKTELEDWDNYIDAVVIERQKHATIALYFHGQWLGTQSSIRNQQISALTGSVQANIISAVASAYGIAVKMATDMYSAHSLEGLMAYHIGQVNVLESDIEASWDNSVTLEGTNEANSIMEAYRDHVATVNHYNSHSSQSKKDARDPPIKPSKWNMPKFPCGGKCGEEFNTPDSPHHVGCGTGRNVEEEAMDNIDSDPNRDMSEDAFDAEIQRVLDERSASDGCGRKYYNCKPSDEAEHKERTCKKTVWQKPEYYGGPKPSSTCNESYRRCMWQTFDHNHNLPGKTVHSDKANNSSSDNQAEVPSPLPSQTMHVCGVHESWQSGDHSAAGCGTSGHYACDGSNHAAAGCGTSGHYACDGSDHSLQASCLSTDSNGNTCTVASFYACDGHTHVYPAPTVTCANGHSYDPTNTAENNNHKTRTCRWCSQTWQKCVSEAPQCLVKMNRKCWAIE